MHDGVYLTVTSTCHG